MVGATCLGKLNRTSQNVRIKDGILLSKIETDLLTTTRSGCSTLGHRNSFIEKIQWDRLELEFMPVAATWRFALPNLSTL